MIISVGTLNPVKLSACQNEFEAHFSDFKITGIDVASEVDDQPSSLDQSLQGAKNRAFNAYHANLNNKPTIAIGIEDGCLTSPVMNNSSMNICCASLYDGNNYYFATSSSFMLPKQVTSIMSKEKIELSEALLKTGLTNSKNIGAEGGAIGIVTQGRLVRKEYTRQALHNLISIWKMEQNK